VSNFLGALHFWDIFYEDKMKQNIYLSKVENIYILTHLI
jgi:hypothetical protein